MNVLIIILIIVGIALIYLALPGGALRRQYRKDVALSLNENLLPSASFTEEAVSGLPEPMQKYLSYCGYMGKPMMAHGYFDFREARLSIAQDQTPITLRYEQYNFVARPDRHAFIDGKLFGLHLINGKDTLSDGKGSMTIVLAKLLKLGETTGPDMSQSQLVSTLPDAVLMPSLFLQDYVEWTAIDDTHAESTITWNDIRCSGIFTFNNEGEIIRFDTNDRYQDNNGVSVNLPWTVEYGDYYEVDGLRRPGTVKISWHMPDGSDYTYFESSDYTVSY
ncbi:MAG: hypothetical protein LBV33_06435 [Lachnospiraceae bacterium]|nr:hypothetical protein [Lachnospiraceae bacterium]